MALLLDRRAGRVGRTRWSSSLGAQLSGWRSLVSFVLSEPISGATLALDAVKLTA